MTNHLKWQYDDNKLILSGTINQDTLIILWEQQEQFLSKKQLTIDVTHVNCIDSAGIALFVQLLNKVNQRQIQCNIIGINGNFLTLIKLYNLLPIFSAYCH